MKAPEVPPDPGVHTIPGSEETKTEEKEWPPLTREGGSGEERPEAEAEGRTSEEQRSSPETTKESGSEDHPAENPKLDSHESKRVTILDLVSQLQAEIAQDGLLCVQQKKNGKKAMQLMFTSVFDQHEQKELSEDKAHYPILQEEELEGLTRLFQLEVIAYEGSGVQWQRRLRGLVASIYESNRSLSDINSLKESDAKVHHARNTNPWANNQTLERIKEDGDGPMEEQQTGTVRFKTDVYSSEEIIKLREVFETPYEFPSELREPTEEEKRITQGMLEGTILAQSLPQFLKRTCNNEMLRVIQNTIHAQVEGELLLRLPGQFPVYPDFQTRDRLRNAMLQGAKGRGYDMEQLTQMLGETKQVCYNAQQHSVHLIFWTREAAHKWAKIYKSLPFRNRRFLVINAHPEDATGAGSTAEQAARVWARQVGRDGITNERQHDRYRIKFLNISRFIDEAGVDAFLRSKFDGEFRTYQEPTTGKQCLQTGTWEIFFRAPGCPTFLEGKRFISWTGTKILIHHAGRNPASPCYNCGKPGHTVIQCRETSEYWKAAAHCIQVTASDIEALSKQKSTVTSFQELEGMWASLQQPRDSPAPAKLAEEEQDGRGSDQNMEIGSEPQQEKEKTLEWISPTSRGKRGKTSTKSEKRELEPNNTSETSEPEQPCETVIDLSQEDDQQSSPYEKQLQAKREPKTILRPSDLNRQRRLILQAVVKRAPKPDWRATDKLKNLDIEHLQLDGNVGERLMSMSGLHEVTTPGTGNCQYYSLAMALLDVEFASADKTVAIEKMTDKLKKGMQMAMKYGFDEEFPHAKRVERLRSSMQDLGELTEEESKQLLLEYMDDICTSSSKSTSFLAKGLWGTELTLRLVAKLLQRPIFVMIARDGLQRPNFQVFEPRTRSTSAFSIQTAGEYNFSKKEPKEWLGRLKKECAEPSGFEHLPIVLIYGSQHYARLRFGEPAQAQPEKEPSHVEAQNINIKLEKKPDLPQEKDGQTEEKGGGSNAESIEEADNEFEAGESAMQVDFEGINNINRITAVIRQPGLTNEERQELQDIQNRGGKRISELLEFSTIGVHGLAPDVQKLLLDLDWGDPAKVEAMQTLTEVGQETMKHWQQQLQEQGIVGFSSTEEVDVDMDSSQESDWTPSQETAEAANAKTPDPDPPNEARVGDNHTRFANHRQNTAANRSVEHNLRNQWNKRQDEWKHQSNLIFPALPADGNVWSNAVKAHPIYLMKALQTVDSPEFIIRSINARILQDWTRKFRIDCLVHGLMEIRETQDEEAAQNDLAAEINFLKSERDEMKNDSYIHGRDYWIKLRKFDAGKNELLKLCKKNKAANLARLVLAAFAYGPELAVLTRRPFTTEAHVIPLMKNMFVALQSDAGLKKSFYLNDPDGDLAALESTLALRYMYTQETNEEISH